MTQTTETRGSAAIPEAEHRIAPTSQSKLDEALAILEDHKQEWAALDIDERIELLEELREGAVEVAERWVQAAMEAKGLTAGTAQEGEEWLGGPAAVIKNISLLIASLASFAFIMMSLLADSRFFVAVVVMFISGLLMAANFLHAFLIFALAWWLVLNGIGWMLLESKGAEAVAN